MVDLPDAFDLGPVMRALSRRKDKKAKAAGHALRKYRDGRSALHDLLFAHELVDFLKTRDPLNGGVAGPEPHAVRGACLAHAILLYVRATVPANQDRLPLRVTPFPTEKLALLHKQCATLRNKGIAHFDYDRPVGDKSFADDVLVVVHNEGAQRIDVADRRVSYQAQLEWDFAELLDHALRIAFSRVQEMDRNVGKYLKEISAEDPTVAEIIRRHPFDAIEFYGSEENARSFLVHGDSGKDRAGMKDIRPGWPDWPKRATDEEE